MKHSIIAFGLIVGLVLMTMFLFNEDPVERSNDPLEDEDIPFTYSLPEFQDYELMMMRLSKHDDRDEIISSYGTGVDENSMDEFDGFDETDDLMIEGPYSFEKEKVYIVQSNELLGFRGDFDSYEDATQNSNYLQYTLDELDGWYLHEGRHIQLFTEIDETYFLIHYNQPGSERSQEAIEAIVENLMRIVRNGMD
ncbi:hypothetical protein [Salisediminibacterium beveridgei]|uniref:hypothetical protein n=1 Tax=Salisediminibacterium beveridgei TaxID=632773 RepID=UPI0012ED8EDF|nr:hypothetical protein [Salisediminibacterium beveridgei]